METDGYEEPITSPFPSPRRNVEFVYLAGLLAYATSYSSPSHAKHSGTDFRSHLQLRGQHQILTDFPINLHIVEPT